MVQFACFQGYFWRLCHCDASQRILGRLDRLWRSNTSPINDVADHFAMPFAAFARLDFLAFQHIAYGLQGKSFLAQVYHSANYFLL